MTKRVAFYLRVSTADGQTTENQLRQLHEVAARSGWMVSAIFSDDGISGAKGRDRRPGLDALLKAVTRREVDLVAAWSVDRLGRSLPDLINLLGELQTRGVDLFLHQQALDTSTPSGRMLFQMLGVFAEFERAMIRERTSAGLAAARAEGRIGGRRRKLTPGQRADILENLEAGRRTAAQLARLYNVSEATISRMRTEARTV